jgi:hypothetical protein
MSYLTHIIRSQLNNVGNSRVVNSATVKQASIPHLLAAITPALALVMALIATTAQAAPRGPVSQGAAGLGVVLGNAQGRLVVVRLTAPQTLIGLRAGDQIIAVDGHQVSTEAAFMQRLSAARPSVSGTTVTLTRNGVRQNVNVTAAPGRPTSRVHISGFADPTQLVLTSQGVMHRETAARLGLPGVPISGTPEWPPYPIPPHP